MTAGRGDIWALSLGTALLIWLAGALIPALRMAENGVADWVRVSYAPAPPMSKDIALVTITEETLGKMPFRSPVNRDMLADAVDKIAASKAKGLAFDILFDQPTEPEADQRLYASLRKAAQTMPVVAAYAGDDDHLTPAQMKFLNQFTEGLGQGLVNLVADPDDGVVRWILLGREMPGKGVVPGFAAALAGGGISALTGTIPLAYAQPPSDIPTYPLHMIPLLPGAWLQGKYLLVGSDLPHSDLHRTPLPALLGQNNGFIPGVAIHAHALNQLLSTIRLQEAPPWAPAPIGFLLALLGALAFGVKLRMGVRVAMGAALLLGYGTTVLLSARVGVLLPILSPLLAVLISCAVKGAREWRQEQRQSLFIQEAFSRYLSPAVVKLLVQDPSRLKLGGEQREITYVFTDIAGFTTISEKLAPDVMAEILNGYLDRMCLIALEHEATIDKIVGDAVVVFFNAPLDQPDHARRAVGLALAYDSFSEAFRAEWLERGIEIGETRVGVNTGRATVGNFGGQRFFNYTGHGDSVNTAARLEGVNKHLGTRICVSGKTATSCHDVPFRPVGMLFLKGKAQGLETFEPLTGQDGYAPPEDYLGAFRMMSDYYPSAQEAFMRLARKYPKDPLVLFHARRLADGDTGAEIIMLEK
ncbi:MAG: adenylate/guanylate cyclase domain-containing protein [Alphaproteobacteria bacterium]|nr:adenylate/guanylate cyclase domain-containing protein [Alphaproteobacteria bacterium]